MRLALCTIARDERERLPRCLASVAGVVDELCVVDTGSRDGTPGLARSLGARVLERPWDEDFAAARNAALELARADWLLVLDADEELIEPAPLARQRLLAFAAQAGERVGRLVVCNVDEAGAELGRAAITRFFPRDPRLRYRGRVHEQLLRDGAAPRRADVGLALLHHGYSPEALAAGDKTARNRRLLAAALREAPRDAYLWYQLARTEAVAQQHARALAAGERALELGGGAAEWGAHLHETVAYALRGLGRSEEALARLAPQAGRWPGRPDTRFLLALLALDAGRLAEAEEGFRACLALGQACAAAPPPGGESARSSSTCAPACNLGVMCEVLGLREDARGWFERALAFDPGHVASRAGLERLAAAGTGAAARGSSGGGRGR